MDLGPALEELAEMIDQIKVSPRCLAGMEVLFTEMGSGIGEVGECGISHRNWKACGAFTRGCLRTTQC